MKFVIVEILFRYNTQIVTIPVIIDKGLYAVVSMLDKSVDVIKFKVIDGCVVEPNHFGYAPLVAWDKWVTRFTEEDFNR